MITQAISQKETKEVGTKYVYTFGQGKADGNTTMKNLLGGKGANLCEMTNLGIPVPPGFVISTEACTHYSANGGEDLMNTLREELKNGVAHLETSMGTYFGDREAPLLLSVRSGARVSMPGMMDTVLNLGLNDEVVLGLSQKYGESRFAWDAYRRFIQMYGDVVMGLKPENKEDEDPFEILLDRMKEAQGVAEDNQLSTAHLKELVVQFKTLIKQKTGTNFPTDPWEQLEGAVTAVFESWNNQRAQVYRELNGIPDHWGTAVNVQAMVYGNLNNNSATGVAFTRDAATGEDLFNGEFLVNAQGEDVVAGIRTPQQITLEGSRRWAALAKVSEADRQANYPSLEELMPEVYEELLSLETQLENHYSDMQDLEFTIQEGKLWILQTRDGKRTGAAMVRISMEMLAQGMIDEKTALLKVDPHRLDELLHPIFVESAMERATVIAKGLPASPGAATGQIVFFADDAESWASKDKKTILVRTETSPEDLRGMHVAEGILTARGGMTSHAAVVARGMGKCCISGAGAIHVDYKSKVMSVDGRTFREGDWISLNGSTGEVFEGRLDTEEPGLSGDFGKLMELADQYARLSVRANADTPEEASTALRFGAKGIGLCRTEHMFFEGERILPMREMILAADEKGRRAALVKLLVLQKQDFKGLFETMHDLPVTIRLLDPPLHEFIPQDEQGQEEVAEALGITIEAIREKIDELKENNPMMGHRGCRLGITFPEVTEMQVRAIIEAALEVKQKGIRVIPEIMVPLVSKIKEYGAQKKLIEATAATIFAERGDSIPYQIGTMIETPRAAILAKYLSPHANFFSFGTNDLTQMTFGYSRDDTGKFLPFYLKQGLLDHDPFEEIDQYGVGELINIAVEKGREGNPELSLGLCGEHGGNPASVEFCHRVGLDYVSCSPYRVPIARLAAAQAKLRNE